MAKRPDGDLDDSELLKLVFQDVTPLPGRSIHRNVRTLPAPAISKKSGSREIHAPPMPGRAGAQLPEIRHGDAPGLDKRSARRLKRGQIKIEARLDLHGLRQEEANRTLTSFIGESYNEGKRCVLVITGKGQVSGEGVLRTNVPRWLNQSPNGQKFCRLLYRHANRWRNGSALCLIRDNGHDPIWRPGARASRFQRYPATGNGAGPTSLQRLPFSA